MEASNLMAWTNIASNKHHIITVYQYNHINANLFKSQQEMDIEMIYSFLLWQIQKGQDNLIGSLLFANYCDCECNCSVSHRLKLCV